MKDSIWKRFSSFAMQNPEKTAIICDNQSISYRLLLQTCLAYYDSFRRQGVCVGMHVGLWIEKSPDFAAALFALFHAGAVVVPINTTYTSEAIEIATVAANIKKNCL